MEESFVLQRSHRKILIAAGGTGGHLIPAQVVAEQLMRWDPSLSLLFVGGGAIQPSSFDLTRFSYRKIDYPSFSQKSSLFRAFLSLLRGWMQSISILLSFRPQLILGFGSKHTFPILSISRLLFIPLIIHEANVIPGKVNRFFARTAKFCTIFFPESAALLQGKCVEAIFPLRDRFSSFLSSQAEDFSFWNLKRGSTTLLIFGGSQGSLFINILFLEVCEFLREVGHLFQVIHISGSAHSTHFLSEEYEKRGIEAVVREYEAEMDRAWRVADLAICRAGAGTIAEQIISEVPSILIPYPHASDQHQEKNAAVLEKEGAALLWRENEKGASSLAELIFSLFTENRKQLKAMKESLSHLREKFFFHRPSLAFLIQKYLEDQNK